MSWLLILPFLPFFGPSVVNSDAFSLAMLTPRDLKPGDHVFGLYCSRCGAPIAVFRDPSGGTKPLTFDDPVKLHATCRKCGASDEYIAGELRCFSVEPTHYVPSSQRARKR